MLRQLTFILLFLQPFFSHSQIFLDESYEDWDPISTFYDDKGDNNDLDIENLAISHDDSFIYFKLEFSEEILLQTNNQLSVILDGSNFTIKYNFGQKAGSLEVAGLEIDMAHEDLGLISCPTVSSNVFEIMMKRSILTFFGTVELESTVDLYVQNIGQGNDRIPNSGSITYELNPSNALIPSEYDLSRDNNADFRICSYNILNDGILDNQNTTAFTSILNTINADIYLLQEAYETDAQQVLSRFEDDFNILDQASEWYAGKEGRDLVIISAYPIKESFEIGTNGVFILDVNGRDVFVCNLHLPCCDKDDEREVEIDEFLEFIRDSKDNKTAYHLTENTPIIIAGDMNFVGNANQVEALKQGVFFDSSFGPDFDIDWDDDGLSDLKPFTTGRNTTYTWYSEFSNFGPGRLDYLFYSDHALANENAFALDTRGLSEQERNLYGLQPDHSTTASDHFPLVSDLRFRDIVSAKEISDITFQLYPNPATDRLFIATDNSEDSFELKNIHGNKIRDLASGINELKGLSKGIYLVTATSNKTGVSTVKKLIVH